MIRMAMYDQGIQLYCATTADDRDTWLSTVTHIALEGRCFVFSSFQYLTKDDYPSATPITNREFEEAKQDMKRRIKLLDPRYVEDFVEEFKRLTQENVI